MTITFNLLHIILFIVGFIFGFIVKIIINHIFFNKNSNIGIIQVDHEKQQCKVILSRDDLLDKNIKEVKFSIDHNAKFSRDEQLL